MNRARSQRHEFATLVAALVAVYAALILVWLWFFGHHWAQAFPKPRTMLALSLVAIPSWSVIMALRQLAKLRRASRLDQMLPRGRSRERERRNGSARTLATGNSQQERRTLILFSTIAVIGLVVIGAYGDYSNPYHRNLLVDSLQPGRSGIHWTSKEPVFLAAIFHNNAKVFPAWSREMLRIIHYLGSENVFVSLVESYSKDETPQLLRSFDETLSKLHVRRKITAGDTSIPRPHNIISNQARIEFLAATRNLALEPLRTMKNFAHGRVLFSNDVFVTAEAVVDLLNMRAGDYDVACGMDFDDFGLYDVWVTRDRLGSLVASVWPFILEPSGRRSIEQNEPAEVFSCWNGITVLPAEPFLLPAHRDNATSKLSPQPLYPPLAHTHPAFETAIPPRLAPALRFRTSGPKECFSSESFLISYDLRRQFGLDKFFINPRVVVAYHRRFFFWNNHVLRHWIVKWWMRNVERGRYLHRARITLSNLGPEGITLWDGEHAMEHGNKTLS